MACYTWAMKLLLALGVIAGMYLYVLLHTTNIVLNQTQQLHVQYQRAIYYADRTANRY